uniref:Uncharacterized protein n=1 Tax=Cucumis melo TaxID=3656 RepID=A0A9I9E5A1_CUCME
MVFSHNRFQPTSSNCFLTIVSGQTLDDHFLVTVTEQLLTTISRLHQIFDLGGNTSMFNIFISNNFIEKDILQESIGAVKPCLRQLIDS